MPTNLSPDPCRDEVWVDGAQANTHSKTLGPSAVWNLNRNYRFSDSAFVRLYVKVDSDLPVACHGHGTTLEGVLPRSWDHLEVHCSRPSCWLQPDQCGLMFRAVNLFTGNISSSDLERTEREITSYRLGVDSVPLHCEPWSPREDALPCPGRLKSSGSGGSGSVPTRWMSSGGDSPASLAAEIPLHTAGPLCRLDSKGRIDSGAVVWNPTKPAIVFWSRTPKRRRA